MAETTINNLLNNGQNVYSEVAVYDTYTVYGNRDSTLPWQSWVDMVAARGDTFLVDIGAPPQLYAVPAPVPAAPAGSFLVFPNGLGYQQSPWAVTPIVYPGCQPGDFACMYGPGSNGGNGTPPSGVPEPSQFFLLALALFVLLVAAKMRPKAV